MSEHIKAMNNIIRTAIVTAEEWRDDLIDFHAIHGKRDTLPLEVDREVDDWDSLIAWLESGVKTVPPEGGNADE